jgi:Domain of unknown function (DUF3850)
MAKSSTVEKKVNGIREHELKTVNPFFGSVLDGLKTFEARRADRNHGSGRKRSTDFSLRLDAWVEDVLKDDDVFDAEAFAMRQEYNR